jgi:hypothetical protein
MRRATRSVCAAGLLGILYASAAGGEVAASQVPAGPALRAPCAACAGLGGLSKQERLLFRGDAALATGLTAEGTAVLRGHAGDLEFRKEVWPDGRLRLELVAGAEKVTLVAAHGVIDIACNDRSARLTPSTAREDDLLRVAALLAGSGAVRKFRLLAAGLQANAGRTLEEVGTLLTDAVVGLLGGDAGVVDRLGHRFKPRRPDVRLAALSLSCYEKWEGEVIHAWGDYEACFNEISPWNPMRLACGARYLLWAESAWFSFLSCSALPISA